MIKVKKVDKLLSYEANAQLEDIQKFKGNLYVKVEDLERERKQKEKQRMMRKYLSQKMWKKMIQHFVPSMSPYK